MGKADILHELPKLSHHERREIMRYIFDLEEGKDVLTFSREATDRAFRILDKAENEEQKKR